MSANTKDTLLEKLNTKKITIEEYVAEIQLLNKQEEEEKQKLKEEIKKQQQQIKLDKQKLEEEQRKFEEEKAKVQQTRSKNETIYSEIVEHYVNNGDVTYLVELCNFFVDIVAKELEYVPSNIFAEKYAEAKVEDVLGAFAALQQKKKKDGDNNLVVYPTKKKMKFTIHNVEYVCYSDYFSNYIKKAVEKSKVDDELF